MLDRTKPPKILSKFNCTLDGYNLIDVNNKLKLHCISSHEKEVVKIDLLYPAGRINEDYLAQARLTVDSIYEGNAKRDAESFNELMEYYGAVVRSGSGMDYASFSLVCLEKHFNDVFHPWFEMISKSAYSEDVINRKKSFISENLSRQIVKNNVISYRELTATIFGKAHPYGYNTMPEHFQKLTSDHLKTFHKKYIAEVNPQVIISGKLTEDIIDQVKNKLNQTEKLNVTNQNLKTPNQIKGVHVLEGPQSNQCSIRMGRRLFPFGHLDNEVFQLLNLILGGYFGSRLVSNIREEKGYCYHIDSSVDTMIHDGFFSISAEVSNENVSKTIEEINSELNRLREEKISEKELSLTKRYLNGQILAMLDGPFAKASLIKNYLRKDANPLDFNKFWPNLEKINAEDLVKMANKYLNPEDLITLVVGKKDIEV